MAQTREIPVYLFTGFLDAGKTTFIQETLEDPQFTTDKRQLSCSARRRNGAFSDQIRGLGLQDRDSG